MPTLDALVDADVKVGGRGGGGAGEGLAAPRAVATGGVCSAPPRGRPVALPPQAGRATTKNSPARNLHRIATSIAFLADLLARLAGARGEKGATPAALRAAAGDAYAATLARCHGVLLRAGVRASLYLLPDRATFLACVGETEASAAAAVAPLAPALAAVVARVEALYGDARMPVSDARFLPAAAG